MTSGRRLGIIAVVVAVVGLSLASTLVKWSQTSGPAVAWWRMLASTAVWATILAVRRRRLVRTAELRQAFRGPFMINGGFDRTAAGAAIGEGRADLVAFGVPYLANPDLPERLRLDASLNAPDPATFYGGDARGYTDYPALDAADVGQTPALAGASA